MQVKFYCIPTESEVYDVPDNTSQEGLKNMAQRWKDGVVRSLYAVVNKDVDRLIRNFEIVKENLPDKKIYFETPDGVLECKIGDALIYETPDGNITIDSE